MKPTISRYFILIVTLLFCGRLCAQTTAEIVEDVGKSVVMILVYDATGSAFAQGSGFYVTTDGWILTNAHVLKNAYSAEVISDIGVFDKVQIMYLDQNRDLGLIRVPTKNSIPPKFAEDTDFRAGQRVIAIGNPLGLERTVSDGLISGIRRTADGMELIQTTVPISPGSSGGVLLNEYGLVIGITTSTFQGGQNINFAISLNTILQFVAEYYKADPYKTKFEQLKLAKESVWYRVILRWIGNIFAFLIALLFGSAFYYVIPLVIIGVYIVYGIIRGLWWLVSYPFRKLRYRKEFERNQMIQSTTQSSYVDFKPQVENNRLIQETEEEIDTNCPVVFHCWKCGSKFTLSESMKGKIVQCQFCHTYLTVPDERISLLLSYYLGDSFSSIFESYGFKVLWAETSQGLQSIVASTDIDLAIEWQHGERDFPVLYLLRRLNKVTPVFLALNWNGKIPKDIRELGYSDSLKVPFDINEMREKFFAVLPLARQAVLKETQFWKDDLRHFGV